MSSQIRKAKQLEGYERGRGFHGYISESTEMKYALFVRPYDSKTTKENENYAYILNTTPHSSSRRNVKEKIHQVIGDRKFTLLEIAISEGQEITLLERIYVGKEKREKCKRVYGRIHNDSLLKESKQNLDSAILTILQSDNSSRVVDFVNKRVLISKRRNSLHLIGLKQYLALKIFTEGENQQFNSKTDFIRRIGRKGTQKVVNGMVQRILYELENIPKRGRKRSKRIRNLT